jgi:hypothetical protein
MAGTFLTKPQKWESEKIVDKTLFFLSELSP